MSRKYSVQEVNVLRTLIETKYLYGNYNPKWAVGGGGNSRPYKEEAKTIAVEEQLRTHMLAGHTAEDLIASENGA